MSIAVALQKHQMDSWWCGMIWPPRPVEIGLTKGWTNFECIILIFHTLNYHNAWSQCYYLWLNKSWYFHLTKSLSLICIILNYLCNLSRQKLSFQFWCFLIFKWCPICFDVQKDWSFSLCSICSLQPWLRNLPWWLFVVNTNNQTYFRLGPIRCLVAFKLVAIKHSNQLDPVFLQES